MEDTHRTAELRRKLDKDPGSRLFAQLAEELRKEGRHEEAIGVARKGLEKNPNYPSARLTLARSLLDSGRPGEARPELEQIVKASPDNILASRLLGDALQDLGEYPQALAQFEKTLRLSPGDKPLVDRIAMLKSRDQSASASASAAPSAAAASPSVFPSVPGLSVPVAELPAVEIPSVAVPEASFPAVSLPEAPLPSAVLPAAPTPEAALPAVSLPEAALPSVEVPTAPAAVALDRDLASGTLSPGALTVSELMHFEAAAGSSLADAPLPPALPEAVAHEVNAEDARTVSFGEMAASVLPEELPAVSVPSDAFPSVEVPSVEVPAVEVPTPADDDIGAQTLPLTSVTLADLYLQQGLKAEASAVLSQVMKEEPENKEAKSKFAAVSAELDASPSADPSATEPAPPLAIPSPSSPPRARRTKAEIREQTILSLKAFESAVEREALQQKATEQRPI
jgi:tetratricopeptide (TPR) repeat protein